MRRLEYIIDDLTMVFSNTASLNLVPRKEGSQIKFRPGQYGLISFLRGNVLSPERPFSFASSQLESESLQFGFRVVGKFTTEFSQLKKGDSVFVRGPFGAFIYDEKKYKDTVFLAAGIGITPFLSAIRYASAQALPNKMTLIYSNNSADEIPYYQDLKKLATVNQNFKAHFLVSNPGVNDGKNLFIPGRISKTILSDILGGNVVGKTFFLCGPEGFMTAAVDMLRELGVHENDIKMEGFSQIPMSFFEKGTGIFPLIAGTSALITLAAFISINQVESAKLLNKFNDAQAVSQQQAAEQQAMSQIVQAQSQQTASVNASDQNTVVVPATVVPVTVTPVAPKIISKPKVVKKPPVYVPPKPVYTPPPVYSPPPQTRMS